MHGDMRRGVTQRCMGGKGGCMVEQEEAHGGGGRGKQPYCHDYDANDFRPGLIKRRCTV